MEKQNPMKEAKIDKVVVNIGVGQPGEEMTKAKTVLESLTESKAVKTKAKVKLPAFSIRPGLEIGLKTTLRGQKAEDFLKRVLEANEKKIKARSFDERGNFGLGVKEHIDLPGVKYDPRYGIWGMDVLVTLERPGARVKRRKIRPNKIRKGYLTRQEAIDYIKERYGVEVSGR